MSARKRRRRTRRTSTALVKPAEHRQVGRPPKLIDREQLKALAALGHTKEEAAAVLRVHRNTLTNRLNEDEDLQAAWDEGRADLAGKLRKAQIDLALAGNPVMLIWLGKQLLSQADAPREINVNQDVDIHYVSVWGSSPRPRKQLPIGDADDVIEGELDEETEDEAADTPASYGNQDEASEEE